MAWGNDPESGVGVSMWNLQPAAPPAATSFPYAGGPAATDIGLFSDPGGAQQAGGAGGGLQPYQTGAAPGYSLLDTLLGPAYTRSKLRQWEIAEKQRQQQWAAQVNQFASGLLGPSVTPDQFDQGVAAYTQVAGVDAGAKLQDLAYNVRDQRMDEIAFANDQVNVRRELSRTMSQEDLERMEGAIDRFKPETMTAKFIDAKAAETQSLMKGEEITSEGIKYDNPVKDQALMTKLAQVLRPREAMNVDDRTAIQMAASNDEFFRQMWNNVTGGVGLEANQRKQIYDLIMSRGSQAAKNLTDMKSQTQTYYMGSGGQSNPSQALDAWFSIRGSYGPVGELTKVN